MGRKKTNMDVEITLDLLKKHKSVSPEKIRAKIANKNYVAWCICQLRKNGYDIQSEKEGRTVVSYVYKGIVLGTPMEPVQRPAKPARSTKKQVVRSQPKDTYAEKMLRDLDMLSERQHTPSLYSVDPEWDAMSSADIANFLK